MVFLGFFWQAIRNYENMEVELNVKCASSRITLFLEKKEGIIVEVN